MFKGALTVGLLGSCLQLGINEFHVTRMKYIVSTMSQNQKPTPSSSTPISTPEEKSALLWERVLSLIGLKQLSDEEYIAQLQRQRAAALARIAELEATIAEEVSGNKKS